jgi:hypothetical protein
MTDQALRAARTALVALLSHRPTTTRRPPMEQATTEDTAKKTKKKNRPEPKRFTRQLSVLLNEKEREKRVQDHLAALAEERRLKFEKAELASEVTAKIKLAAKAARDIEEALREGKELREVKCIERFLWETHGVDVVREDTGEVIETRAMTSEERQPELPLLERAEKNGAAKDGADHAPAADVCGVEVDGKTCSRKPEHKGVHAFADSTSDSEDASDGGDGKPKKRAKKGAKEN